MSKFDWNQKLMVHDYPGCGPGELRLEDLYTAISTRLKAGAEAVKQDTAQAPPENEGKETWETLRRDALRYRWLRNQHWTSCPIAVTNTALMAVGTQTHTLDRLDETIDALMKRG